MDTLFGIIGQVILWIGLVSMVGALLYALYLLLGFIGLISAKPKQGETTIVVDDSISIEVGDQFNVEDEVYTVLKVEGNTLTIESVSKVIDDIIEELYGDSEVGGMTGDRQSK